MNSKQSILEALRANSPAPLERGPLGFTPMKFEDPLAEFKERVVKAAAARCMTADSTTVDNIIKETYPDAKHIASNLKEVGCATIDPDTTEDPRELAGTDVAVVRGAFGVAENGAVWIPRSFRHKALLFVPEALVILLDRKQIVCTMHDAYARPDFDTFDFGSFIAGPSKTADIEQALVIGAHGPRDVTVILL